MWMSESFVTICQIDTLALNKRTIIMPKNQQLSQIAIYQTLGSNQKIHVRIEDENVWLTQKLISELFDIGIPTVNEHLTNIFESGELSEDSVIRNFRITAKDGKTYDTKHYNLDAILAQF